MSRIIMVTAPCEGGFYSLSKNSGAPIRIYADRRVEDDIFAKCKGHKRRERLSKKEYRRVLRAAKQNHNLGRV